MGLELFPHNQTAYDAAMDMIAKYGKAAVIHPTGTGKSMIAFWLAFAHSKDRICWLSPSSYIYQTQKQSLAEAMPEFSEEMLSNVTFLTYAKLMSNEDEMCSLRCDWIICDEFHRAGSQKWGNSVRKLLAMYPDAGVLGLSATNVRYLDHQRDMAEELFDGHIASEITLGDAIARNILPAPVYIISMYAYGKQLTKLKNQIQASGSLKIQEENEKLLEKLKRALEQSEGLEQTFAKHMPNRYGKYLVFCSGKGHMEEMMQKAPDWFSRLDRSPHLYSVLYGDPASAKNYTQFLEDNSPHLKLLFSVDMLNEGIHVKDVDGVILLRPTVSPILYLQQIGRALAAGKKSRPVIFDIVDNFESLYTIDSIRLEVKEAFLMRNSGQGEASRFQESFQIIDKLCGCREIFGKLKKNLLAGWELYFERASSYYEENGNLRVPKSYQTEDGLSLGAWILTQKRVYAGKINGTLTDTQKRRLESIGMEWDSHSTRSFEKGYRALQEYHREYGNVDVKASYVTKEGYPLGRWVGNIRRKYKGASGRSLTKEQKRLLEDLGMIWDKAAYQWDRNFNAAKKYYSDHGNLEVSHRYITEDGVLLGVWIENQRAIYAGKNPKAAPLSQEQIKRLNDIGMEWDNERQWRKRYHFAELYYRANGSLKAPAAYTTEDGKLLARWVGRQREQYKKHTLSEERRELLSRIGFEGDMDSYGG